MPPRANQVMSFEIPATEMARAKEFGEAIPAVEFLASEICSNATGWFPMEGGATGASGT